jgi:hypothetical protein
MFNQFFSCKQHRAGLTKEAQTWSCFEQAWQKKLRLGVVLSTGAETGTSERKWNWQKICIQTFTQKSNPVQESKLVYFAELVGGGVSEWAIDILFRCRSKLKPEIRTQVEVVPIHKFYYTCFVSTRLLSIEILGSWVFSSKPTPT